MKEIFRILKMLVSNLNWKIVSALLSRPLLLIPTIWATVESVWYAQSFYPDIHGGNGVANAFRHTVWNALICKNSSIFTNPHKAADWAKYTTDLHEEVFANDSFDRKMDLHNNRIGRLIFLDTAGRGISKKGLVLRVRVKCKTAKGVNSEEEIDNHPDEMVYIRQKK